MKKIKIWNIKKYTIKFLSLFIVLLFFSNIIIAKDDSQSNKNIDETQFIEDFTWSVLKYDHVIESRNFGPTYTPRPMPGLLVMLSNMMDKQVCKIALSIYDENRMELLKNLRQFCINNVRYSLFDFYTGMFKYRFFPYLSSCKSTAEEMLLVGDRLIKDYYQGFCYSQACLNTAILRLCGVPAEEVFNIIIPFHAFTVVKIDGRWYGFDSAKGQHNKEKKYIYDELNPKDKYFSTLENDRYFINFETYEEEIVPSMQKNYSNMQNSLLIDKITGIQTLMSNSILGSTDCNLYDFINNSIPYPGFENISVPYTVHDACGQNNDEKANHLANLIKTFVEDQSGGNNPNQYDRCLYSMGVFPGKYPQAYTNAAKYGAKTGTYAKLLDSKNPNSDIRRVALWVNLKIKTREISKQNHVFNTELIYSIKKGSTIDKALVSYGTLRNMKKHQDFWQPDDLFVIVTDNNQGYLAVNHTSLGWIYLNFGRGLSIQRNVENINFVFNEEAKLNNWNN